MDEADLLNSMDVPEWREQLPSFLLTDG